MSVVAKIAHGIDLATSKNIPDVGDFWIDPKTNNGKIGDGKTPMFELPWVSLGVDLSTEPPRKYKMPDSVKNFIEKYIDLIEECHFDEVYDMISHSSTEFTRDFTRALLEAGLNPKPYLTTVPRCIQDLLLDTVDNLDNKIYTYDYDNWNYDASLTYTKADLDKKLHEITEELTKKMYKAMGISAHLMTIKTGE